MRFPFYHQLESNDCGATCIRMICSFYGRDYALSQIKGKCVATKLGVTVADITNCSTDFGLENVPVKCELSKLKVLMLPVILHWKPGHFVVLYQIKDNGGSTEYHIADPAFGKVVLNEQELKHRWLSGTETSGIAILCQPAADFKDVKVVEADTSESVRTILSKYKPYASKLGLSTVLLLASIAINWAFPILFQKLVDFGIGEKNMSIIWQYALIQMIFVAGYVLSSNVSSIILMKMNFEVSTNYLSEFILKVLRLPIAYFDSKIKTDYIQRIDDQARLQQFLSYRVISFAISLLSFLVFSSLLLYYSTRIFAVFAVLTVLSFAWTAFFLVKRKYLDYNRFAAQAENRNAIQEILDGMPDIKMNNAQRNRLNVWESTQKRINQISLKAFYLNYYQQIGSSFVDRLRDVVIITVCAFLILNEQSTLGTLLTISYILGQLTYSLSQIYQFSRECQDAKISLDRLSEIQHKEEEHAFGRVNIDTVKRISLDSVSFKYYTSAKSNVIENVSLDIPVGKTTAIVGKSGSGKTTLAKLLLGFYDPQKGMVLVNGEPLDALGIDQWREKCGAVLQDGFIFSSTIAGNIALGEDSVDLERVKYAAKIACADEFINALPNKYQTKIGNAGIQLSGGQKQRLLIARAVYKEPEVLVFDEATSHLDTENERKIVENLQKYLANKTRVIIAHRLSTVMDADKIIYLRNGQIAEEGTHAELLSKRGFYYDMIQNQLQHS